MFSSSSEGQADRTARTRDLLAAVDHASDHSVGFEPDVRYANDFLGFVTGVQYVDQSGGVIEALDGSYLAIRYVRGCRRGGR